MNFMRFGWIADSPDIRDYSSTHPAVTAILSKAPKTLKTSPKTAAKTPKSPSSLDLRPLCPPILDQGNLGSCTANAACGVIGFYQKKTLNAYNPVSRLFIYKASRDLLAMTGDNGATLRATMGALALLGAPPEKYWEYDISKFDLEPPPFCYSFASNYQALVYFRHDDGKKKMDEVLSSVKSSLDSSIPSMFGFTVYSSLKRATGGRIPFPSASDSVLGGHAVMACGYDDKMKIGNCVGAFLIRNSWGPSWGEAGYGWLPYKYLLKGVAQDFWSLVKEEWVDLREFGI